MKSTSNLPNLVQDVYSLFENNRHECNKENLKELIHGLAKAVVRSLKRTQSSSSRLRFSNLGRPDRRLYYELNQKRLGLTPEPLRSDTKIMFLYGDILEELLIFLVKEAGYKVADRQKRSSLFGVRGSQDCTINNTIVDIKSASPFSFAKFNNGTLADNDAFGYIGQISAYVQASEEETPFEELETPGGFFVINKSDGQLCYLEIDPLEQIDVRARIKEVQKFVKKDVPPARCYDVSQMRNGNEKLKSGCSYCDFRFHCYSDANDGKGLRAFQYSDGVTYLTKVASTPRVKEITDDFRK